MIWQFRLIDSNNISTIVEEPVGWDGISCSFTRNMSHHGIFSNINTSDFEWVDTAYDLLLAEYNAQGANGNYQLLIEYECADGDGYTTYFQGKFDFNTLERQCLDYCFIKCSVTTTRCADIFLSRMGQDVNVLSTENFDGETNCPRRETRPSLFRVEALRAVAKCTLDLDATHPNDRARINTVLPRDLPE